MITQDFISTIRASGDIVQIISELIPLKKAGSLYKGCCPFHNENTPSFTVSPTKQIYKCFGCGEAGDAIRFVQQHKQMTFTEAVVYIAGRLNLVVEYEHRGPQQPNRYKDLTL